MKNLKRILCIFLSLTIILIQTTLLSSCAKQNDIYISNGDWITLVDDSFGMTSYNNEEPYIKNIDKSNDYFDAIQIACEWDIINPEDELNIDDKLILSYALVTLVNCIGLTDYSNTDEEKIKYAIENFNVKIRNKDLNKKVNPETAIKLIDGAKNVWRDYKYLTPIEEVSYAEGVKDYSEGSNQINDYKTLNNGIIAIPKETNKDINVENGDVYILPTNGETIGTNVYKAENVTEDNEFIYIANSDDELDLYDVAQDIKVEETFTPRMENTIVYDGNGQVVSSGTNIENITDVQVNQAPEVAPLGAVSNQEITSCAAKVSHSFEIQGFKVGLEYDLNDKFDLKATVSSDDLLKKSDNSSLKASLSIGVSDLDVTQKVDYSWFKLKEADRKSVV